MSLKNLLATTLSKGLPVVVAGCSMPNSFPIIYLTELDGTLIRTTESDALAREYGWDQAIVLPINREDVYSGNEKFVIYTSDADGPEALTSNFYALTNPFTTSITQGTNEAHSKTWYVSLGATENISRGTYPIAAGVVDDGYYRRTVGILGAFERGSSYEE